MATPWPTPCNDERSFGSLGTSLRTGVEIRMAEQHQALESHARECAGGAEQAAKRHAEEHVASEIQSFGAQVRTELAALAAELRSIESRTSAAEVRLDQSEASTASALKDRESIWAALRKEVAERIAEGVEAERRRAETEGALRQRVQDAVEQAATARVTLSKQFEERLDQLAEQVREPLGTMRTALDELHQLVHANGQEAEAWRKYLEDRLVEAEAAWRAVHQRAEQVERHAASWNAERASEAERLAADCRAHAEACVEMRGKDLSEQLSCLKALLYSVKSDIDANVDALASRTTDGLGMARAYTDRVSDEVRKDIADTNSAFHTSLQDCRSVLDTDTKALYLKQADIEAKVEKTVSAAEARAVANAFQHAEGRLSHVQRDINTVKATLSEQIEEVQQAAKSQSRLVADRATGLEKRLAEAENSAKNAVLKTATTLRGDFEEALRGEGRRIEAMMSAERERAARLEIRGGC